MAKRIQLWLMLDRKPHGGRQEGQLFQADSTTTVQTVEAGPLGVP